MMYISPPPPPPPPPTEQKGMVGASGAPLALSLDFTSDRGGHSLARKRQREKNPQVETVLSLQSFVSATFSRDEKYQ